MQNDKAGVPAGRYAGMKRSELCLLTTVFFLLGMVTGLLLVFFKGRRPWFYMRSIRPGMAPDSCVCDEGNWQED